MEKILKQSLLYDFYGELLNNHQKNIYEDFVLNDLSLSEIAEQHEISRQGVHDIIKRCDKALDEYEKKLHLVEKFIEVKKLKEQLAKNIENFKSARDEKSMDEIENTARQIIEKI
jgi:predicted DNA-binding protein YlxM (UPF0122 family)